MRISGKSIALLLNAIEAFSSDRKDYEKTLQVCFLFRRVSVRGLDEAGVSWVRGPTGGNAKDKRKTMPKTYGAVVAVA